MKKSLASLLEALLSASDLNVRSAGEMMLAILSDGSISTKQFHKNPQSLIDPDHGLSRYIVQVVWRSLERHYTSVDEIVSALHEVLNRNPPMLEARLHRSTDDSNFVVIPEAKILNIQKPFPTSDGSWVASFDALVTAGPLREREIKVRTRSSVNPTACFIVQYLWVHISVAAYNIVPVSDNTFEDCSDTFFVLEPLRQVNASSIARAVNCPKPIIDEARRGRGDVTVYTVKGMFLHAMFDLMLEGEEDIDSCYEAILPRYLVQMAVLSKSKFSEDNFRKEVLSHAAALSEFIKLNPHMKEDSEVELRRYSGTLGVQGRIDAVFRTRNRLDLIELKTGSRLREEDHWQLFVYRLLLSDWLRSEEHKGRGLDEVNVRLLSSRDGSTTPLRTDLDFSRVLQARNRLLALSYAMGHPNVPVPMRYADFNPEICNACPSWTRRRCTESSKLFGDNPDSILSPELQYFRQISTFVQAEKWAVEKDLVDLIDDSRVDFRLRNFRAISNTRCSGFESGHFVFDFEENNSDLTIGDRVLVHSKRISSSSIYHGYLKSVGSSQVRISIPLNNLSTSDFKDSSWTIDRFPSDQTSHASQTALYDFLTNSQDVLKQIVLGNLSSVSELKDDEREKVKTSSLQFQSDLNPSQIQAVRHSVECKIFHLIWGPPGTGKTKMIPEIVVNSGGSVLLGAFTNTALDKILLAMLEQYPKIRFIRIGRSKDSPELAERLGANASLYFSEDLAASTRSSSQLRDALDSVTVMAATAHRASTHPYLRARLFGMVLVDEAGQLTEPLTLGLLMRATRFVLIGDDQQLPPVVRVREFGRSMFERLKEEAESSAPELVTLLDTQYRMHPEIMAISNKLYYSGRLFSGVTSEDRAPSVGSPILFLPVRSNETGRSNSDEALAVCDFVKDYRTQAPSESIGVISPFRAQVVLLRKLIKDNEIVTDTVERFQGGERDVIIISFVRSSGTDFVFDDKRFNVALSRARKKLVMIAHPDLFHSTRYEWILDYMQVPPHEGIGSENPS